MAVYTEGGGQFFCLRYEFSYLRIVSFEFGRPKASRGRKSFRKESGCLHCMQHFEQIDECWTGFNLVFTALVMMSFQQYPLTSMASHICSICYCTAAFKLSNIAALSEQKLRYKWFYPAFFFKLFVSFPKKKAADWKCSSASCSSC